MSILKTIRDKNIIEINKIINNKKISENIETSIYNFSIEYTTVNEQPFLIQPTYDTKYSEISDLLINKKNIINALINNTIDSLKIAYLKPEELDPETFENFLRKKKKIEDQKDNEGVSTYTCSKCNESKVKITQQQTRAADEPPTIFVKCLKCHHTFKF